MVQRLITRFASRRLAGGLIALLSIAAAVVGVIQYMEEHPRLDLTGEWIMVNTIDRTSFRPYKGLRLGYRMFFHQDGSSLTGDGEKCWENGAEIPATERVPLHLVGSVRGDDVVCTFIEKGMRRQTTGTVVWSARARGDSLLGEFTHTAANASGRSVLVRSGESMPN